MCGFVYNAQNWFWLRIGFFANAVNVDKNKCGNLIVSTQAELKNLKVSEAMEEGSEL